MNPSPAELRALLDAVTGRHQVLVLTHDNPDPDALASAFGLAVLLRAHGHAATLAYGGVLGRAENRAMARLLHLQFRPLANLNLAEFPAVALVDTQPGSSNHSLPPSVEPRIVLDHHRRREHGSAVFQDVRPEYGACATLVGEYLQVAGIAWNERLATALFYGIKSDTRGLSRGAHEADAALYLVLHHHVNQSLLGQIEQAPLSPAYFETLHRALTRATVYGPVVFAHLGAIHRPDIAAEMADLLLRADTVDWSVVTGEFGGELIVSLRTTDRTQRCDTLIREIVGTHGSAGGHGHMAAGRIYLNGSDAATEGHRIEFEIRSLLGVTRHHVRPLVPSAVQPPGSVLRMVDPRPREPQ